MNVDPVFSFYTLNISETGPVLGNTMHFFKADPHFWGETSSDGTN